MELSIFLELFIHSKVLRQITIHLCIVMTRHDNWFVKRIKGIVGAEYKKVHIPNLYSIKKIVFLTEYKRCSV